MPQHWPLMVFKRPDIGGVDDICTKSVHLVLFPASVVPALKYLRVMESEFSSGCSSDFFGVVSSSSLWKDTFL